MLLLGLLFKLNNVAAHGSGAWLDPAHANPSNPLAGMRYIAEAPPHVLTMVGSDDGSNWWSLKGYCDTPDEWAPMTAIHFDFSAKVASSISASRPHPLTTYFEPAS